MNDSGTLPRGSRTIGAFAPKAFVLSVLAAAGLATADPGHAQSTDDDRKLADAAEVIHAFSANDADAIPTDLLERARGIAVIPNVFRGGFILGARRGRGVLVVRSENGEWSNPAFITLTGGSIGWQIGAETADVVLVFANDNAVKNMSSGKFTLGGDATAVAGPLGRRATAAVTFKAEVYGYVRAKGLFAGASFEGTRLKIDHEGGAEFYAADPGARPLQPQNAATPPSARRFLLTLERATLASQPPARRPEETEGDEAVTFPLE
jgi:lipid-binding SYLF domain-containing protein